jgi:hypothetical protein
MRLDLLTSCDFVRCWGKGLGKGGSPVVKKTGIRFYGVNLHRNNLFGTIQKSLVSPEGNRRKAGCVDS